MSRPNTKLFQPIKIGDCQLQHRVVLAPLTRMRAAQPSHVPQNPVMQTYYTQRASEPGTLLFTEGTFIAEKATGYPGVPGIWSGEQVTQWKEITNSVHSAGSFIYLQMWTIGRAAMPAMLEAEGSLPFISSSDVKMPGASTDAPSPRPLTVDEIQEYVQFYANAADNAVNKAGFDGVEVHCANGYLLDQFLQDTCNCRSDSYGGSVENRCRFPLEVIDAVVSKVGQSKVGFRVSPWSPFQGMLMKDPIPTFTHFVSTVKVKYPNLSYLHVIEPRMSDPGNIKTEVEPGASNDFLRRIWGPRPFISAGGYTRETAIEASDATGELIAMGRYFIANPDIVKRFKKNIPLNEYDRASFYLVGDASGKGYTDYPFASDS